MQQPTEPPPSTAPAPTAGTGVESARARKLPAPGRPAKSVAAGTSGATSDRGADPVVDPLVDPLRVDDPLADPVRVDDPRLVAWRSFLRTHNHLLRILEQDLQSHRKLALATYDVLVQLAEAPDNRLRMSELAQAVLLSRSGLTRLVDRMQKDGLVRREPDPYDARGLFTVLAPAGRQALRDASQVHLTGVSQLVLDRLSAQELATLNELMVKLDPVVPTTRPVVRRY